MISIQLSLMELHMAAIHQQLPLLMMYILFLQAVTSGISIAPTLSIN
jgi:hypothetical protein